MVIGGTAMILLSIFGKFSTVFTAIPSSIVGGILAISLSMVTAEGLFYKFSFHWILN